MVQKRPFDDDESNNASAKQPRQLEANIQLVSALEFPCDSAVQSPHASGEGDNSSASIKCNYDEKLDGDYAEPHLCPKKDDAAANAPISFPCFSWATSSTSEEDIRLEAPFHILLSPDYYNSERPPRNYVRHGEMYASLLDQPPKKLVPLGPDFQADIPEWRPREDHRKNNCSEQESEPPNLPSQAIESVETEPLDYENRLAGTVLIPMPDSKLDGVSDGVGLGRTNCLCGDVGSIRCVQQHIREAREKLKRTLGPETFAALGFCDMGEVVAEKWSEEEEQLFHEVILSNPASLGKNFWDYLAIVFPSRTMKEIVSYYFNVFMLRKRAYQNRCDPMNIDSDNDEWQGTEDSADNEAEIDEDDDSMVESPVDHDRIQNFDKDLHVYDEDTSAASSVNYHSMSFGSINVNVLQKCPTEVSAKCSSTAKGSAGIPSRETGVLDGSCTSVDGDTSFKVTTEKSDNCKWTTGQFSGHEFMLEACNSREWDVGYLNRSRNDVDLLPTCSVIEEVFGAGSWARDGRELS